MLVITPPAPPPPPASLYLPPPPPPPAIATYDIATAEPSVTVKSPELVKA